MILTKPGSKTKPASKIAEYFPSKIDGYLEPFFGGGGMFFNLKGAQKPQWAAVNDLDAECHNLWHSFKHHPEKVKAAYDSLFYAEATFLWLKNNVPDCPFERAARYLALSNWGYLGKRTFGLKAFDGRVKRVESMYEDTFAALKNVMIGGRPTNACDFLELVNTSRTNEVDRLFVYCDPPYLDTDCSGYKTPKWKEADLMRLFDVLQSKSWKWALSEFDHPFVLAEAERRGLFTHIIGERNNLKNRRTEILITNYKPEAKTLFQ